MTNPRLIFTNLKRMADDLDQDQKTLMLIAVRALEVEFARLESENAHLLRALPLLHSAAVL